MGILRLAGEAPEGAEHAMFRIRHPACFLTFWLRREFYTI
jgi:hypothetical protein